MASGAVVCRVVGMNALLRVAVMCVLFTFSVVSVLVIAVVLRLCALLPTASSTLESWLPVCADAAG